MTDRGSKFYQTLHHFYKHNQSKLIYTVLIFTIHFTYGIVLTILGTAMIDYRYIYDVPFETISFLVSFQALGYLIGSFVGWLYKWFNRQLLMIIFLFIMAATTIAMPFYGTIIIFFIATTLNGIGAGAWDSSQSAWLVEMWSEQGSAVMQGVQFMYGFGNIILPILVSPFLHGELSDEVNHSNHTINETIAELSDHSADIVTAAQRQRSLAIPFSIAGISMISVTFLLALLYCFKPYRKSDFVHDAHESSKLEKDSTSQIPHRKLKLAIIGICISTYGTAQFTYMYFSASLLQYMDIKFSPSEANQVLALVSITYTLGRLLTAFITLKVKVDFVIVYHYLIVICAMSAIFIGRDDRLVIYIASAFLGYGFSALWPGLLGFTESHLKLDEKAASLFSALFGVFFVSTPLILGKFLKSHPLVLFLVEAAFLLISIIFFIIFNIVVYCTNSKQTNKPKIIPVYNCDIEDIKSNNKT